MKLKETLMVILLAVVFMSCAESAEAKRTEAKTVNLYVNQSRTLSVGEASGKVIWKTSNKKVVKVNKKGKITGLKKGDAVITAVSKADKKVKAKCKVKVWEFAPGSYEGKTDYYENSSFDFFGLADFAKPNIISSVKELEPYLKVLKKDHMGMYKKYSQYDSSFFEENSLVWYTFMVNAASKIEKVSYHFSQQENDRIELSVHIKVKSNMETPYLYTENIYPVETKVGWGILTLPRKDAENTDDVSGSISQSSEAKRPETEAAKLSAKTMNLYVNQSRTLSVGEASGKVIWKTSNKKVVKVNKKGKITGLKKGNAVITAVSKADKKIKAKCKVNVREFAEKTLEASTDYYDGSGVAFGIQNYGSTFFNLREMNIIDSQKELKLYLETIKKTNIEAYNKYSKYDNSFFEDNSLLWYTVCMNYTGQIDAFSYQFIQNEKGRVQLVADVKVGSFAQEGYSYPAAMKDAWCIVALPKKDAECLDDVVIK